MSVYDNIRRYRQAAKLSQDDLAARTGYTDRSSIAKIESGVSDISVKKLCQFADALGVTPGQLLGEEEAPIMTAEAREKNGAALDIVARCGQDKEFSELVQLLMELDTAQARNLRALLSSFNK